MNYQELQSELQKWLEESLFKANKEFSDTQTSYKALSETHELSEEIVESFNKRLQIAKFRYQWIETQLESLKKNS